MSQIYALKDTLSEPIRSVELGLQLPPVDKHSDFGQKVQQQPHHHEKAEKKVSDKIDLKKVNQQAEKLNQLAEILNRKIQFFVDSKNNKVIVKVIDPRTGEVIRKIPPEKIFKLEEQLNHAMGFLLDERV